MCTELGIKFSVLYPDSTEVNNKTPTQCNPVISGTGLVPIFYWGRGFFLTIVVSSYKYSSITESLKFQAIALLIFLNSAPHGRFLWSLISRAKKKSMITIVSLAFLLISICTSVQEKFRHHRASNGFLSKALRKERETNIELLQRSFQPVHVY